MSNISRSPTKKKNFIQEMKQLEEVHKKAIEQFLKLHDHSDYESNDIDRFHQNNIDEEPGIYILFSFNFYIFCHYCIGIMCHCHILCQCL